jgi:hypothetical protein
LGSTGYTASSRLSLHYSTHEAGDLSLARDREQFARIVQSAIDSARFLALSVRPGQWQQAEQRLRDAFELHSISFDELLLRHLHQLCDGMARPPDWQVVLRADAAAPGSMDWSRLQSLVRRVLPAMADELSAVEGPVLLTDTGLIARYGLIDTWLADLRQRLQDGRRNQALLLLIANDTTTAGAVIDGHSLPSGAGSKEYARIPSAWLHHPEAELHRRGHEAGAS